MYMEVRGGHLCLISVRWSPSLNLEFTVLNRVVLGKALVIPLSLSSQHGVTGVHSCTQLFVRGSSGPHICAARIFTH